MTDMPEEIWANNRRFPFQGVWDDIQAGGDTKYIRADKYEELEFALKAEEAWAEKQAEALKTAHGALEGLLLAIIREERDYIPPFTKNRISEADDAIKLIRHIQKKKRKQHND